MRLIEIKKKSGGVRRIVSINDDERAEYRNLMTTISVKPLLATQIPNAFLVGRNAVTNAIQHINKAVTITLDLKDFFDTVRPRMVVRNVPKEAIQKCFLDENCQPNSTNGAPRQGLPTSPIIANIAAMPLDAAIQKIIDKSGIPGGVYTRYADDMAISFNTDPGQDQIDKLIQKIAQAVSRNGFKINEKKTRIQRSTGGRRVICGISVGDNDIRPCRSVRRKLRSAIHHYENEQTDKNTHIASSLSHYCLMERPDIKDVNNTNTMVKTIWKKRWEEANILSEEYNLRKPVETQKVIESDIDLGDDCVLTGDPVAIMLMSSATHNWTSCMNIQRGGYRAGLIFWVSLPGCLIAYRRYKNDIYSIHGIKRPVMYERCLVWKTREGSLVYGDLYSPTKEHRLISSMGKSMLIDKLLQYGAKPASKAIGETVVGNVDAKIARPYCDNCHAVKVKLKKSGKSVYKIVIGK